jgi:hypothetical protein
MSQDKQEYRSPCICSAYFLQVEENEGDFFDPKNEYPRNGEGKKFRRMWAGCPQHAGHTNRCEPTHQQLSVLMTLTKMPTGYVWPHTRITRAGEYEGS